MYIYISENSYFYTEHFDGDAEKVPGGNPRDTQGVSEAERVCADSQGENKRKITVRLNGLILMVLSLCHNSALHRQQ